MIIKELTVPFIIGTFTVVLMFQINAYMFMAKTFNLENVPFSAVVQYILFRTPEFIRMTLPVGTSLGTALAFTRLARESEITAMRAAGIRTYRIILPVFLFGLLVSAGNYWTVEKVMPESTRRANDVLRQASVVGLNSVNMKSNALIELGKYTASLGTVLRDAQDRVTVYDVVLFEQPERGLTRLIQADEGSYDRGVWTLKNANFWEFRGKTLTKYEVRGKFEINEKIVVDSFFGSGDLAEITSQELREKIASAKRLGVPSKREEIELETRISIPVACAIFAMISPVFAMLFARSGGFVGILVSFIIVLAYYNAFVVSTEILGKMSEVPVWAAAWLPNIVFLLLGIFAIRKLE